MAYRFNAEKFEHDKREREEARVRLAIQQMDAMPDSAGLCYFIGCYLDGEQQDILKIGYSRSLNQRMNRLKSNTAIYKLRFEATINGGREREAHYHRLFADDRFSGEWFTRSPEIEAEIERIRASAPSEPPVRWG